MFQTTNQFCMIYTKYSTFRESKKRLPHYSRGNPGATINRPWKHKGELLRELLQNITPVTFGFLVDIYNYRYILSLYIYIYICIYIYMYVCMYVCMYVYIYICIYIYVYIYIYIEKGCVVLNIY